MGNTCLGVEDKYNSTLHQTTRRLLAIYCSKTATLFDIKYGYFVLTHFRGDKQLLDTGLWRFFNICNRITSHLSYCLPNKKMDNRSAEF